MAPTHPLSKVLWLPVITETLGRMGQPAIASPQLSYGRVMERKFTPYICRQVQRYACVRRTGGNGTITVIISKSRKVAESCLAITELLPLSIVTFPILSMYVMHEVTSVPPETRKLVCVITLVHQRQVSRMTACIILLKGGWRPLLSLYLT